MSENDPDPIKMVLRSPWLALQLLVRYWTSLITLIVGFFVPIFVAVWVMRCAFNFLYEYKCGGP